MKALKIIWLFCTIGLLSACTADDVTESSGSNGKDDNVTTAIAISLDNLLPVNMNSRTTVDDCLSQINDLNIRVTTQSGGSNSEKYTYIYCTRDQISIDDQSYSYSKAYYIDNEMNYIHLNDIAAKQVKKIEVIANNGSSLYKKDWNSVLEEGDNNLNKGYCMMYGETTSSGEENAHEGQGSLNCRKFTVKLKRTRAMLTVQLKGIGLKSGVSITPKKIRLHNVPVQCTLTSTNVATAEKRTDGEAHDINWGTITSGVTVGTHIEDRISDTCLPLYLFENMQGQNGNTSSGQKVTKYPVGCSTVVDAKKNRTHSYVEIEADYRYESGGNLKNSGTIIYRFFLGKNDYNDFNVERNTYYKLTLSLKGFGGASEDGKVDNGVLVVNNEDVSWRVDMDIRDWGFEKDEYDFDAHAVMGEIAVMGSGWTLKSMEGASQASSWLRFKSDNYGSAGWAEPTDDNIQGEDGKIIFYIQPMQEWEFTSIDEKRTITLTIQKGNDTQIVTISQWTPVRIGTDIWMERFEEEDCMQTWGFSGVDVTNKTINLNGSPRKYATGEDVQRKKELGNTYYGYQEVDDAAHAYCFKKGGGGMAGSPAGATAEPYCLPDQATFNLMLTYSREHLGDKCDPVKEYEDYWTSSVPTGAGKETSYWSGKDNSYVRTADRTMRKRTRAVFIGQIYE